MRKFAKWFSTLYSSAPESLFSGRTPDEGERLDLGPEAPKRGGPSNGCSVIGAFQKNPSKVTRDLQGSRFFNIYPKKWNFFAAQTFKYNSYRFRMFFNWVIDQRREHVSSREFPLLVTLSGSSLEKDSWLDQMNLLYAVDVINSDCSNNGSYIPSVCSFEIHLISKSAE